MKKKWVEYAIARVPDEPGEEPEIWELFGTLREARKRYNARYKSHEPIGNKPQRFVLVRETYEVLNVDKRRTN